MTRNFSFKQRARDSLVKWVFSDQTSQKFNFFLENITDFNETIDMDKG